MALTPIVVTSGGTSQQRHDQPGDGADQRADGERGDDPEEHHAGIGAAVRQLGHDHRGRTT